MADDVATALNAFRSLTKVPDDVGDNPFTLACSLDSPASTVEIGLAWSNRQLPNELVEAWSTTRTARLFEDVDYGQWGLVLLAPDDAARRTAQERAQRADDFRADDIVIGEFLGDLDLVVHSPSSSERVLIALPLDHRRDWYRAASSLAEFLDRFLKASGKKYWERTD